MKSIILWRFTHSKSNGIVLYTELLKKSESLLPPTAKSMIKCQYIRIKLLFDASKNRYSVIERWSYRFEFLCYFPVCIRFSYGMLSFTLMMLARNGNYRSMIKPRRWYKEGLHRRLHLIAGRDNFRYILLFIVQVSSIATNCNQQPTDRYNLCHVRTCPFCVKVINDIYFYEHVPLSLMPQGWIIFRNG